MWSHQSPNVLDKKHIGTEYIVPDNVDQSNIRPRDELDGDSPSRSNTVVKDN